jgi:hypothetical protein
MPNGESLNPSGAKAWPFGCSLFNVYDADSSPTLNPES